MPTRALYDPRTDYTPERGVAMNSQGSMSAAMQGMSHGLLQGMQLKRSWEMEDKERKIKEKLDQEKSQNDLTRTQIAIMNAMLNKERYGLEEKKYGLAEQKAGREQQTFKQEQQSNTALSRAFTETMGFEPGADPKKAMEMLLKFQEFGYKGQKNPLDIAGLKEKNIANKWKAQAEQQKYLTKEQIDNLTKEEKSAKIAKIKQDELRSKALTEKTQKEMAAAPTGSDKSWAVTLTAFKEYEKALAANPDDPEAIYIAMQNTAKDGGFSTEVTRDKDGGIIGVNLVKPASTATTTIPAQAGPPAGAPPDARQAPDGNWYVQKNGKYFKVVQ